jgi:hypothetical protein
MATFEKAVLEWADDINAWYSLSASKEEVTKAFYSLKEHRDAQDEPGDIPYVETFFHGLGRLPSGDPVWRTMLDTVDREMLADLVEQNRGNKPLPTYADTGGTLLNKVRKQ